MLNRYKTAIQNRLRKGQACGRATWHQRQLTRFLRNDQTCDIKNLAPSIIATSTAMEFCD